MSVLIAVPLVILSLVFGVSDRLIYWIIGSVIAVLIIWILYNVVQLYHCRSGMTPVASALDQAQADEWKRRIRFAADTTDMSGCELTLEELCDYFDDDHLTRIVEELQKMPAGGRDLRRAYEIVEQRAKKCGA
ncbi:MAG TPA: hypothetical protein VMB80_14685 [Candidatus Acidoferrum sp.]|nr:hypothetical protein [Candidatus Acidoferrum sp.]